MVTVLIITTVFTLAAFIAAAVRIRKIEQFVRLFDEEQHDQNKLIMTLLKENQEMKEMLLQHIEILKYLCDQDPILKTVRMPYTGPIGEA